MKKYIALILITFVCIATTVFATPPPIPSLANTTTLRDSITSNDGGNAFTDTMSLVGYSRVRLDMIFSGTSFDVTPLCQEVGGTEWFSGDTSTITKSSWLEMEFNGCSTFSVKVDGEVGSSEITIKVTPYNQ